MNAHKTGYAPVNGLEMYYEVHGSGDPVVLLHGTFSAIGTSFGQILPHLAKSRQVIGLEMQGHGRTADIDRPLTVEQLADDTGALLDHLGIAKADLLGYSLGSAVALQLGIRRPELVRKQVLISIAYNLGGLYPGMWDGMAELAPEMLVGSPWHDEYLAIAPNPDAFADLVSKVSEMNKRVPELTAEEFGAMGFPTLVIIGDSDIIQPEHAVEMFRLLGGGVIGDAVGLPASSLAILPGTTHVGAVQRTEWIVEMANEFLDRE